MGLAIKIVAALIWIYSYITLGFLMAIAAVPGFLLGKWGFDLDVLPTAAGAAAWREGLHAAADALVGMYFSILGFFVFGIALMFVLPFVRFVFHLRPRVGTTPIYSFRIWSWYNLNGMQFMFNTIYGRFARATTLYPVFLRMMGARIGKNVVFNTQHVYDLDILTVGDHSIIGANASILGHVGEKGKLVRAPITIGKNCTVGQYANLFPGVTMGDNCHVGAMSLVPKGSTLDSNAVYAGVPVRKVKDLKPGEKAVVDEAQPSTAT